MFGVSETPYDLRFQFLGIPVRVHPLFWLGSALLAGNLKDLSLIAIWVACVFVSILAHEYGHGLMAKAYRSGPSIVLWMGGGLCYSQTDRQTPRQRLAVVLWGPGAGFVLCGAVMLVTSALFGVTPHEHLAVLLDMSGLPSDSFAAQMAHLKLAIHGRYLFAVYWFLVQINIFWGLVNLLPIWPLDGGHVGQIVLSHLNPREGRRWSHIVSLITAGFLAIIMYTRNTDLFLTMFFGYFAFLNFQVLQSIQRAQSLGFHDEDWWRR